MRRKLLGVIILTGKCVLEVVELLGHKYTITVGVLLFFHFGSTEDNKTRQIGIAARPQPALSFYVVSLTVEGCKHGRCQKKIKPPELVREINCHITRQLDESLCLYLYNGLVL